jgi:hypothetical protein
MPLKFLQADRVAAAASGDCRRTFNEPDSYYLAVVLKQAKESSVMLLR